MLAKWIRLSLFACAVGVSGSVITASAYAADIVSTISAAPCCARYADMPFMPLPNNEFDYKFELSDRSPAFDFADGRSYFQTFQLPAQGREFKFRVSSVFGKTILIPVIQLLDDKLNVVREIKGNDFTVDYGNLGRKVYYTASFDIDNGGATPISFLVVKADVSSLGGETQIMSAARKWAKETGLAQPVESDPVIPHALTGEMSLSMEVSGVRNLPGQAVTLGEATTTATLATAVATAQPSAASTSASKPVAPAKSAPQSQAVTQAAAPVEAMLGETEQFYNQQIIKAVKAGDIEKAMTLTNEAQRAGSKSAKKTFVDAVKSSQH